MPINFIPRYKWLSTAEATQSRVQDRTDRQIRILKLTCTFTNSRTVTGFTDNEWCRWELWPTKLLTAFGILLNFPNSAEYYMTSGAHFTTRRVCKGWQLHLNGMRMTTEGIQILGDRCFIKTRKNIWHQLFLKILPSPCSSQRTIDSYNKWQDWCLNMMKLPKKAFDYWWGIKH